MIWGGGVVGVVVEFPWEQLVVVCVVTFPLKIVPPEGGYIEAPWLAAYSGGAL